MVRPERTFEQYSRGAELIQAIYKMWIRNEGLSRHTWDQTRQTNRIIAERIEELLVEYDLTYDEWHYWYKQAVEALP